MPEPRKTRPDFLIVGAMKCGTSTLAAYLSSHPALHLPVHEVHFFDREPNFRRGPEWYARQLWRGCPSRKRSGVLLGEKTPTYSYQADCAERMHRLVPKARLIWIFRDPVERTYSNYLHRWKKGAENLRFEEAIAAEAQRIESDVFLGYVERSKYVLQIERFLNFFSLEQMHFLTLEALLQNPLERLNAIAGFLACQPFVGPLPPVHRNATRMPVSPLALRMVGSAFGYDRLPYRTVRRLSNLVTRPPPPLPPHMRPRLQGIFDPYNARLAELTGLDISPWSARG